MEPWCQLKKKLSGIGVTGGRGEQSKPGTAEIPVAFSKPSSSSQQKIQGARAKAAERGKKPFRLLKTAEWPEK